MKQNKIDGPHRTHGKWKIHTTSTLGNPKGRGDLLYICV